MYEETRVSRDYKEAYNQGYEVAKELGLRPGAIEGINAGSNRMQAMKDGMEQYGKELTQEKGKDIIPPLDLDSIENVHIDLDIPTKDKDKDKGMDI